MTGERLQKVIARAGVASRRGAERLIREGRVTVNGRVATLGDKVEPDDAVKVDGRRVAARAPGVYLLLNKPDGVLTSRSDTRGRPTVMDLVPARYRRRVFPVGRLDYHTEGLLLLTDDGDLAQRVSHPRHGCVKRYEVKVKGVPGESAVASLERGVVLDGRRTAPARVRPGRRTTGEKYSWWTVEIGEGRTRQVREMFFRIGHPVQRLRRVAIGALTDRGLPRGAWRRLSPAEVASLRGERPPGRTRGPAR
ncbi:MAG: pseudouridine synthase [Thermoanaerobaculia bacterium]|nr:pseudouridine synthase [Thermoanaerobaculia bacterium]